MANGLSVVCIRIPVIEKSTIADAITIYNIPNGLYLSEAIINTTLIDNREIVKRLDEQLKKQINYLIYG